MILDNPTYIVMAVSPVSGDNRLFFGSQVTSAKKVLSLPILMIYCAVEWKNRCFRQKYPSYCGDFPRYYFENLC